MMTTKQKTTTKTTERTNVRTTLSSLEEKVVRMRHGLAAPTSMVLERQGEGNAAVSAQLEEIERRALLAVGARQSSTKDKIVGALRKKDR